MGGNQAGVHHPLAAGNYTSQQHLPDSFTNSQPPQLPVVLPLPLLVMPS
jgi:hypothetical protein